LNPSLPDLRLNLVDLSRSSEEKLVQGISEMTKDPPLNAITVGELATQKVLVGETIFELFNRGDLVLKSECGHNRVFFKTESCQRFFD
jgi:hypothetical protein